MKKVLCLFILLISLNSSANLLCTFAEKGIEVTSESISKIFKCENTDAIVKDLKVVTKYERLCAENEELYYSLGLTCRFIARNAAIFMSERIPEEWECDEEHSETLINAVIYKSCKKIFERD